MKKNKVFIISLHKTGTTSLKYLLERLGYLVTGPDTHLFEKAWVENYEEIDEFLRKFDAFQDDPWYMLYPYVYKKYPDAKFIFLKRELNSWIESIQNFYGRDQYNNKVRRLFYGNANTLENRDLYISKYNEHNKNVRHFFENNPNYIEIDVKEPSDVLKLQVFLGERIKFHRFPHKNKAPKNKNEKIKKNLRTFFVSWFGLKSFF